VTTFRLNAGKSAPYLRSGLSAPTEEAAEVIKPIKPWYPSMEEPIPLHCGCSIPWPVITLLGSGGKVQCDLHGWQPPITKKEIEKAKQRARKAKKCHDPNQQILSDVPPF
jgi:hypothetical protein